jgi:hypothetical protein
MAFPRGVRRNTWLAVQAIELLNFQPRPPFCSSQVYQIDVAFDHHLGTPHPSTLRNVSPAMTMSATHCNRPSHSLGRGPLAGLNPNFA